MIIYSIIFITALLGSMVYWLSFHIKKISYERRDIWFEFAFSLLISFTIIRPLLLLRKTGFNIYSILNPNTDVILKTIIYAIIINVSTFFICKLIKILYCKRKYLVGILLPFSSVFYFVNVCLLLCVTLGGVDNYITNYSGWNQENSVRNIEGISYRIVEESYPLIWNSVDGLEKENNSRILVLGDSFIWGDGCGNSNLLWWNVLEKNLHNDGYNNCDVIAVGQCGASTEDQFNWIKNTTMIEDISPDLIIIGYVTNDPSYKIDGEMECRRYNSSLISKGLLYKWFDKAFPNVCSIIASKFESRKQLTTDFDDETGYPYDMWEKEIIKPARLNYYSENIVRPLVDELKKQGIPLILLTTPTTPNDSSRKKYKDVLPIWKAAGADVKDCLDEFIVKFDGVNEEDLRINPVNGHPGPASNKMYADYITNVLETNYTELLGEKISIKDFPLLVNDWMPHNISPEGDDKCVKINYPGNDNQNMLFMPLELPYVQIDFKYPINPTIIKIITSDGNIPDADVWVTKLDDMWGYDSQELFALNGGNSVWNCDYNNVTSVCIHVDTDSSMDMVLEIE